MCPCTVLYWIITKTQATTGEEIGYVRGDVPVLYSVLSYSTICNQVFSEAWISRITDRPQKTTRVSLCGGKRAAPGGLPDSHLLIPLGDILSVQFCMSNLLTVSGYFILIAKCLLVLYYCKFYIFTNNWISGVRESIQQVQYSVLTVNLRVCTRKFIFTINVWCDVRLHTTVHMFLTEKAVQYWLQAFHLHVTHTALKLLIIAPIKSGAVSCAILNAYQFLSLRIMQ